MKPIELSPAIWPTRGEPKAAGGRSPHPLGVLSSISLHLVLFMAIGFFGQQALRQAFQIEPTATRFFVVFETVEPPPVPVAPKGPATAPVTARGFVPLEMPSRQSADTAGLPEIAAQQPVADDRPPLVDVDEFASIPIEVVSASPNVSDRLKPTADVPAASPPTPQALREAAPGRRPAPSRSWRRPRDVHPPVVAQVGARPVRQARPTEVTATVLASVTPPRKPQPPAPAREPQRHAASVNQSKPSPMMVLRLAALRTSSTAQHRQQSQLPAGCRLVARVINHTPPDPPTNDLNGLVASVTSRNQQLFQGAFGAGAEPSVEQWQRDLATMIPQISKAGDVALVDAQVSSFGGSDGNFAEWWQNVGPRDSRETWRLRQAEWAAWQRYQRQMAGVPELSNAPRMVQVATYECDTSAHGLN